MSSGTLGSGVGNVLNWAQLPNFKSNHLNFFFFFIKKELFKINGYKYITQSTLQATAVQLLAQHRKSEISKSTIKIKLISKSNGHN